MQRIRSIAMKTLAAIEPQRLSLISAGVAFYGFIAVFPMLAALVAIWSLFADPEVVVDQVDPYSDLLPDEVSDMISDQLSSLAAGEAVTLGGASLLSFLVTLWAARLGVSALIQGLNAMHGYSSRGTVKHGLAAIGITLMLILVGIVAIAVVVAVPVALAVVPVLRDWAGLLSLLRWTVGIGVVLAGVALLYRFGPNHAKGARPPVWPGAIAAVVLWSAASMGLSAYLRNFGSYDAVYGSLAAVPALLLWFYASAFVVLLGGLLNEKIDEERRAAAS